MKISRLMLTAALLISTSTSASATSISASVESQVVVVIGSETPAPKISNGYTGIIIDCRGFGLQRAMSPVIKDERGVIIYGDKNLDEAQITNFGMAHYATDMSDVSRAGTKPLIIRAIAVENFNRNPVLSLKDADRVLLADNDDNFLKNASVVFLTD